LITPKHRQSIEIQSKKQSLRQSFGIPGFEESTVRVHKNVSHHLGEFNTTIQARFIGTSATKDVPKNRVRTMSRHA